MTPRPPSIPPSPPPSTARRSATSTWSPVPYVHSFLSKLSAGTVIVGARATVTRADSDNHVDIRWDGKLRLEPDHLLKAYEFLDKELADADWKLDATGVIVFPTGKDLVEWQKALSLKIASSLITQ